MGVLVENIWIEKNTLLGFSLNENITFDYSLFFQKTKKLHKVLKYTKGGSYLLDLGLKGLI
jgi:hypothetical protein